jgi:hypothetical protein
MADEPEPLPITVGGILLAACGGAVVAVVLRLLL